MQRIFLVLFILIISTALIMCAGEKKEEAEVEVSKQTQETMEADTAMAVCPGCGMEMKKSEMVTHEVDEETHHFCSQECMENYLATHKATETEEEPSSPPAEEQ